MLIHSLIHSLIHDMSKYEVSFLPSQKLVDGKSKDFR